MHMCVDLCIDYHCICINKDCIMNWLALIYQICLMYLLLIQGIYSKIQLLQPTHHASTMFVKHAKARR